MTALVLENVCKSYAPGVAAVQGLCLEIKPRELLVLVGPSGCGKTTTLRLIAGLEQPDSGTMRFHNLDLQGRTPKERNVAFVPEHGALYPHLSVFENLAFGLRIRLQNNWGRRCPWTAAGRRVRGIIERRVRRTANQLGLNEWLDRRPEQLSAGQRSRVALARAIARRPALLLLDEPLANLDNRLKLNLRRELKRWQRQLAIPMLCVTHDQADAMALGDRIAVMQAGKLLQTGTPTEVYRQPAHVQVAELLGAPAINVLAGTLRTATHSFWFDSPAGSWQFPAAVAPRLSAWLPAGSRPVQLGMRPSSVEFVSQHMESQQTTDTSELGTTVGPVVVQEVEDGGENIWLTVQVGDGEKLTVRGTPENQRQQSGWLKLNFQQAIWFDAVTGENISKPSSR